VPTSVFIDNNCWDFFMTRRIDLAVELPSDEFRLFITREAEFEFPGMPPDTRAFAEATMARCGVRTDAYFGFAEAESATGDHRFGGFGSGRWPTPEERSFNEQQRAAIKKGKRPTRLHKGEADLSLAARASHSVVLTLDAKPGPIKTAFDQSGKVVFLNDFDASGLTLRAYILAKLRRDAE
jgi:hypothetical protein